MLTGQQTDIYIYAVRGHFFRQHLSMKFGFLDTYLTACVLVDLNTCMEYGEEYLRHVLACWWT
jgi:hypothetical protein